MDFSPMHPDIWAKTNAERWNEYIQLRSAYEEGRDQVKRRRGDPDKAKKGMESLIQRVTGGGKR